MQLDANTPTKQRRQSRNFVIKHYNINEILIIDIIVRNYNEWPNCCPFTRTLV